MSKLLIATLALVVAARGEPCSDGSDTCQASDDEVTLAQLRATKLHTFTSRVACNYGGDCNGNQCCPGAEETCGQTYKCPNANSSFQGCEYNGAVPKPGCDHGGGGGGGGGGNSCCCWWWPAGVTKTCGNCGNCEKSTPQDWCHGGQSGSLWCPDGENLLQKSSTAAEQGPTTVEEEEMCAKSPNSAYGVFEDPCCENLEGPGCDGKTPVGCAAGGLPQRCRYCFLPGSDLNDGSLPECPGDGGGGGGAVTTSITDELNDQLQDGLLVRAPDFDVASPHKPGTFWRSDIHVPNQFYIWDEDAQKLDSDSAIFGYVADPQLVSEKNLFADTATLYAHDANACDSVGAHFGRCTWFEDENGWECPSAWAGPSQDQVVFDTTKIGAGNYLCQGCHFVQGDSQGNPGEFDSDPTDRKFFATNNCECACTDESTCKSLAADIAIDALKMDDQNGAWRLDHNICWTNNLDWLVEMQNTLWDTWKATSGDQWDNEKYWGWNEVAVKAALDEPVNWKSNMIYMAPGLSNDFTGPGGSFVGTRGLEALNNDQKANLDNLIGEAFAPTKAGHSQVIEVGWDAKDTRPGSYVVIARQNYQTGSEDYAFEFFCQSYVSGTYQVCAKDKQDDGSGYCYIEHANVQCH